MRNVNLLILLPLLLMAGQAGASSYFIIYNVSQIQLSPNSQANFSVSIREIGADGGYAQPLFKNATEGLNLTYSGPLRYILPTAIRRYNCTIAAGNIAPGSYSFYVGAYGQGSPYSWKKAYAEVVPAAVLMSQKMGANANNDVNSSGISNLTSNSKPSPTGPAPVGKSSPGLSALLAIGMVAAARKLLQRK